MPINPYFQSGIPQGIRPEQNLVEDLIIECLKIYGFETYYIAREAFDQDPIFREDPQSMYKNAYPLEMYLQNIQGFEGEGELLTKFGVEIRDSATFVVSRRRWTHEVARDGNTILPNRPAEGDVIYFPLTQSYFEIRKVVGDQPFYQIGKLYVYALQCELMQFDGQIFETGIQEIDVIAQEFNQDEDLYSLELQDGTKLILENGDDLVFENYNVVESQKPNIGKQNDILDDDITDILDFTERHPFGNIQ